MSGSLLRASCCGSVGVCPCPCAASNRIFSSALGFSTSVCFAYFRSPNKTIRLLLRRQRRSRSLMKVFKVGRTSGTRQAEDDSGSSDETESEATANSSTSMNKPHRGQLFGVRNLMKSVEGLRFMIHSFMWLLLFSCVSRVSTGQDPCLRGPYLRITDREDGLEYLLFRTNSPWPSCRARCHVLTIFLLLFGNFLSPLMIHDKWSSFFERLHGILSRRRGILGKDLRNHRSRDESCWETSDESQHSLP